jgi:hypothetical protein
MLDSPRYSVRGDREEKRFRSQEPSAPSYCTILTALVVANVEEVPRVMFQSPACKARRDRD